MTSTGGSDSGGEAGSTQNLGGEGGSVDVGGQGGVGGEGGSGGEPCVATGPDLCNGVDDDCSVVTVDGQHEIWWGDSCDGDDADECEEGIFTCDGAGQVCDDDTADTLELCAGNDVDEDCDGETDEGFVQDTFIAGACPVPVDIGSTSGDSGTLNGVFYTESNYEEAYYKFTLTENNGPSDLYLGARVELLSPTGSDYDVYVYCTSCSNPQAASSILTAPLDAVDVYITDTDADNTTDLVVKIVWFAPTATACGEWQLTIKGNYVSSATPICAPL
jgi:hypothetical protein